MKQNLQLSCTIFFPIVSQQCVCQILHRCHQWHKNPFQQLEKNPAVDFPFILQGNLIVSGKHALYKYQFKTKFQLWPRTVIRWPLCEFIQVAEHWEFFNFYINITKAFTIMLPILGNGSHHLWCGLVLIQMEGTLQWFNGSLLICVRRYSDIFFLHTDQ